MIRLVAGLLLGSLLPAVAAPLLSKAGTGSTVYAEWLAERLEGSLDDSLTIVLADIASEHHASVRSFVHSFVDAVERAGVGDELRSRLADDPDPADSLTEVLLRDWNGLAPSPWAADTRLNRTEAGGGVVIRTLDASIDQSLRSTSPRHAPPAAAQLAGDNRPRVQTTGWLTTLQPNGP